ncbi:MAG: hypothetical protein KC635_17215 [Myxococcales bacterium]|nr:hypothetical protein [Myxococcales bacterium]
MTTTRRARAARALLLAGLVAAAGQAASAAAPDPPFALTYAVTSAEGFCQAGHANAALAKEAGALAACFRAGHVADGVVDVLFIFEDDGRVDYAKVTRQSAGAAGVAACVRRAVEALRVRPPDGGRCTVRAAIRATPRAPR